MDDEKLLLASELWNAGKTVEEISEAVPTSRYVLDKITPRNRDLFPVRKFVNGRYHFSNGNNHAIVKAMELPADRMKWKLENGVCITLPRVSSISCPR